MPNFNADNFKIGACVVAYKGKLLGGTRDGVKLSMDADTIDVTCDQAYGQVLKKVVTAVRLSITMTMMEIETNLDELLVDNKISGSLLGSDLLQKGGELLLAPINSNDKVAYRFPSAVLEPQSDFSLFGAFVHTLQLRFTASANANGDFFEKVTLP